MTPGQLLLILLGRWKLALFLMAAAVAIAVPVIQSQPQYYKASTSLVVDVRSADPFSAMLLPSNMSMQEDIIKSERVAMKVVKMLKLDQDATLARQRAQAKNGNGKPQVWLASFLRRGLSVTPPRRDSTILTIDFKAEDPAFAAAVANAYAQAYIDTTVELKVEPAKQYARWFGEQSKSLRENLERAQARLSQFQQEKRIVARDETMDTEVAKLSQLTTQLTTLQSETAFARSKQRSGGDLGPLPEVLENPVVQGLRSDIARQEAKLKEAGGNLGSNHPQYRRMAAELSGLKERLQAETRHVASSLSASGSVGREREKELVAAVEAQKAKLLELRSVRDQLAVLQRDVDAAQSAYDAVARRHDQTSLESQATQTNVFQLTPAVEPPEPSHPRVMRLALIAVLLGAALALGGALGLEMIDRRVRSADDVAEMLQLPVLAVIERRGRRRLPRRLKPRGLPAAMS